MRSTDKAPWVKCTYLEEYGKQNVICCRRKVEEA